MADQICRELQTQVWKRSNRIVKHSFTFQYVAKISIVLLTYMENVVTISLLNSF